MHSLTRCVFQHTVVSKIFDAIGYKLIGTALDEPLYKKTLIAESNADQFYLDEGVNRKLFLGNNQTLIIPDDVGEVLVGFTGSGTASDFSPNFQNAIYTFDTDAAAIIRFVVVANVSIANTTVTARINVNGVEEAEVTLSVTAGNQAFFDVILDGDINTNLGNYRLYQAGDEVTFTIEHTSSTAIVSIPPFSVVDLGGGLGELLSNYQLIDVQQYALANVPINPVMFLPEMDQDVFLRDVIFDNNIQVSVDNASKTVRFDTKRFEISNALDWSSKIDLSEAVELNFTEVLENYGQRSRVLRAEADDEFYLAYNNFNRTNYGDGSFFIDNDWIPPIADVYESPFSASVQIRSFDRRLAMPFFGGEQFSDVIPIKNITQFPSASGVTTFVFDNNDTNVSDFENQPNQTVYLLVTETSNDVYQGIYPCGLITQGGAGFPGTSDDTIVVTNVQNFAGNASGNARFVRRGQEIAPKKIIDYGVVDLDAISSLTSLTIHAAAPTAPETTTEIPYVYFFNPIQDNVTDNSTITLAYDIPNLPSDNVGILEKSYQKEISVLQNSRVLKAYFRIDEVDLFNLDYQRAIYLDFYVRGQRVNGYFRINIIEEYIGEKSTPIELISI
jgi:hypothetical protein